MLPCTFIMHTFKKSTCISTYLASRSSTFFLLHFTLNSASNQRQKYWKEGNDNIKTFHRFTESTNLCPMNHLAGINATKILTDLPLNIDLVKDNWYLNIQ